ncbi:MAG: patatin-like phospholipase family protein [Candidatus Goldiibacteriota bacterium]
MKFGLALGGGAGYGLAHIGVLKVLEAHGLKPDMVSGTSAGSIIGGIYASGVSPAEIEELAMDFNWLEIASMTIPREGLISIEKLETFIKKHSRSEKIENTKIKFAVMAADLLKGEETVFEKGPMGAAIRASCSLPGIFNPAVLNGSVFVDGGILNNVPVNILRRKGCRFVLGVDVMAKARSDLMKKRDIFNIVWTSWQLSIQENTALKSYKDADYIIKPEINNINPFDITKKKEIIKKGEDMAEQEIAEIKKTIKRRKSIFSGFKKRKCRV